MEHYELGKLYTKFKKRQASHGGHPVRDINEMTKLRHEIEKSIHESATRSINKYYPSSQSIDPLVFKRKLSLKKKHEALDHKIKKQVSR